MRTAWRRILRDLKDRRFIEVYSASLIAFSLAIITLIADIVPEQVRWAALLAGVGLLVFRITIPPRSSLSFTDVLRDPTSFYTAPISELLANANEVWIFGPSAINFLSARN